MFHSTRPMLVVLFATILPLASAHADTVSSCVLDGGGIPTKRSCGAEKAVSNINEMYGAIGIRPKQAVLTKRAERNNLANFDCIESACNDIGHAECLETTPLEINKHLAIVPAGRAHRNEIPGSLQATRFAFYENCFPVKQDERIDVCHFWTFNQANEKGVKFSHPLDPAQSYAASEKAAEDNVLTPAEIRSKAGDCRTFRYVANTPHSETISQVAFDANGRVLANRCGISASRPQSDGVGMSRDAKGNDVRYSFNESLKKAVKSKYQFDQMYLRDELKKYNKEKAPSLDDLAYFAMTDGPATEDQPTLTSDLFLEQTLKSEAWTHSPTQNACRAEIMSQFDMKPQNLDAFLKPALHLLEAGSQTAVVPEGELDADALFSPAEKEQIQYDMKRLSKQVKNIEDLVAIECGDLRCPNTDGAQAMACGASCAKFGEIHASFTKLQGELKAEVGKARGFGNAEKLRAAEAKLRDFMTKGNSEFSPEMIHLLTNYTALWNRLSNFTKLVHSGAVNQNVDPIKDYLALRRCELGAFDKITPESADAFMAPRKKIASTEDAY